MEASKKLQDHGPCKSEEHNTQNKFKKKKTYNSRCSLVVTDPTTDLPLISLSMGERTGSRIFLWLWSYVLDAGRKSTYDPGCQSKVRRAKKTYNSRCSLVVTDPTTNLPLTSLTMGERTGSRAF